MGWINLSVSSKTEKLYYVHVQAETPAFFAKTSFYCDHHNLVEFGKKIRGFPRTDDDKLTLSIGDLQRTAEFNFQTVGAAGQCELWIRISEAENEDGRRAEAYFPLDYLDRSSIAAFSEELVKMGTGYSESAEIKNKFENV